MVGREELGVRGAEEGTGGEGELKERERERETVGTVYHSTHSRLYTYMRRVQEMEPRGTHRSGGD